MERESLYTIFNKVLGGHSQDFDEFARAHDDINKSLVRAKRSDRDLAVEVLNEMMEKDEIDSNDGKLYIDFIDALNKRKAIRAPMVHFKNKLRSDVITFEDEQVSLWIIYLDRLKAIEAISQNKLKVMDKAVAAAKLFNSLSGFKDTNQRHFINSYYISNLNRLNQELKESLDRESDLNNLLEQKESIIQQLEDQSALKDREIEALQESMVILQMKDKNHDHSHNDIDLVWECEWKQVYLKAELEEKEKLIKKLLDDIKIKDEVLKDKSDSQISYNSDHSYLIKELELKIKHLNSELETKDDIIALLKTQSSHNDKVELDLDEMLRLQDEYKTQIHTYSLQVAEYESRIQILKNEIVEKNEFCTKIKRDYKDRIAEIEKQIKHYENHLHLYASKLSTQDEIWLQDLSSI